MIRIRNISFFRFCKKNGKLDWPKCARTVLVVQNGIVVQNNGCKERQKSVLRVQCFCLLEKSMLHVIILFFLIDLLNLMPFSLPSSPRLALHDLIFFVVYKYY